MLAIASSGPCRAGWPIDCRGARTALRAIAAPSGMRKSEKQRRCCKKPAVRSHLREPFTSGGCAGCAERGCYCSRVIAGSFLCASP